MEINGFYEKLDRLFATGQIDRAGELIEESRRQAEQEKDREALLAVLNEGMGYYRSIGSREALKQADQALALLGPMGLEGTVQAGTTALNAATAYRAFGENQKAAPLYEKALAVYQSELGEGDYRLAGLYNNLSSLYADEGEFDRAAEELWKALAILERTEGTEAEQAVSYTNLTVSYLRSNRIGEAEQAIQKAITLFEAQPGERDAHYGMALAGKAELHFVKHEFLDAIQAYREALDEIRRCYGESLTYAAALENCANICITAGYMGDAEPLLAHAARIKEEQA